MTKSSNRSKSDAKPKAKAKATAAAPRRRQLRFQFGARGKEIGGLLLLMVAVLLMLALSNLTRGSLSDWISDRLYWLFGWGAFFFVVLLGAIGVLIIARTQNIVMVTP